MSDSLVKLLDHSIIPASAMLLSKIFGVFLIIWLRDLPWSFQDYTNNFFRSGTGLRESDIKLVTSYSDIILYIVMVILFSVILFRALFFHNTHIKPSLISRLANQNLLKLVQSSYDIYHAALINLIFLWVATLIVISNSFLGRNFLAIGVFCFIYSVILTTLLFQDIYREIENIKKKPHEYEWV